MFSLTRERRIREEDLAKHLDRCLYSDNHPPTYFTTDSVKTDRDASSLAFKLATERGEVGGEIKNATYLPWTAQQLRKSLPSWLKIYPIDNNGQTVYIVNPSSKFLEDTTFYLGLGGMNTEKHNGNVRFLFRGESRKTSTEDTDAIIKQLRVGELRSPFQTDNTPIDMYYHPVYTGACLKHSVPYIPFHSFPNLIGLENYQDLPKDSGHLWVIDVAAMDGHLVNVHYGGAENTFPRISSRFLRACITTPQIKEQVEQSIEVPSGFLISSETMEIEELEFLVKKLELQIPEPRPK